MEIMKYIKTYKMFENINSNLISELDKYGIENYIINDDGSIDVKGDVDLGYKQLTKIPIKFKEVSGSFYCLNNRLTSLKGSPIEVGGDFICSYNQLESLEYCPLEIGDTLNCSYNKLTMLDCSSYIKGDIYCWGMFGQEPEFFGDCEGKIDWKIDWE